MSLRRPPEIPLNLGVLEEAPQLKEYLNELEIWTQEVWSKLKFLDIGDLAVTAGIGVPTGGQDGDWYYRVNGANTSVYQNINGTWTLNT